jgi:hypothetical protein
MIIISMPKKILAEVTKSAILIEKELPVKQKSMAQYCPNNFNNDKSKDNDDEDEHYEKKTKKKSKKMNIDTIREDLYCQNCFHEGMQIINEIMSNMQG